MKRSTSMAFEDCSRILLSKCVLRHSTTKTVNNLESGEPFFVCLCARSMRVQLGKVIVVISLVLMARASMTWSCRSGITLFSAKM